VKELYRSERTQILREWIRSVTPQICPERAKIATDVYRETEDEHILARRAKVFRKCIEQMTIWIHNGELIVGNQASTPRSSPIFPETTATWIKDELRTFQERPVDKFAVSDETYRTLMEDVFPYWEGKTIQEYGLKILPEEAAKAWFIDHRVFSPELYLRNSVGHLIADYEVVLKEGYEKIIEHVREKANSIDETDPTSIEKKIFFDAVISACETAIIFAKRFSALAIEMSKNERNPVRKAELLKIAEVCEQVPAKPARTFYEAVQSFWFLQLLLQLETDGLAISTDRFDELMYPYYTRDVQNSILDRDKAQEIVECLWIKTFEMMKVYDLQNATYFSGYSMGQVITIGGQDRNGHDNTNELSFVCMDAEHNMKLTQPNLAVRISKNTPDEFLFRVCRHIAEGTGKPHLFNDDVIIPSLMNRGIKIEDARHYGLVGCVEATPVGSYYGWTNASMFNMPKCLEFALNDGKCMLTWKQVALKTGDATKFTSIEEVKDAYRKQVEFFVKQMTIAVNAIDLAHQARLPMPYLSASMKDCIANGKDVSAGGARYNFSGLQGVGIADVADSMVAIDNLVFKNRQYTMKDFIDAMTVDFKGYDQLRKQILAQPKYGNDIDEVDLIAAEIGEHYCSEVAKYRNARGGMFHAGLYPVSANVPMGLDVAATPSGRYSMTPLADGVSPAPGADHCGPTAVIKSVAKLDHMVASNGTLLNLKFSPNTLKTPEQIRKFMTLIRTYFELDGWHMQFNVVSADTLRKAQEAPEKYKNLLVRVAGYSAFFVDLDLSLQENIIERTEFTEI